MQDLGWRRRKMMIKKMTKMKTTMMKEEIVVVVIIVIILTTSVVQWSEFLAADPDIQGRFATLPDCLRSSGSETGSTQPREYN
jgi:hypothetical protein